MDFQLPPIIIHNRLTPAQVGEQLGYWIEDYGIDRLWESSKGGQGVMVGICDTGISGDHMEESGDLHGAVKHVKDFTGSRVGVEDVHGHGTHVAGIIAARSKNGRGVAGVAPKARLTIAKVLGDSGNGSDQSVAEGIIYCVDQGCQIINCSLGGAHPSRTIQQAIAYAHSKNCIVVCASGNEAGRVGYPAAEALSLCVGAIDARKVLASFSNRGNEVDVVAPGVEILSTYARGGYATLSGTSMATPWLSGLLALMLSNVNGAMDMKVGPVRKLLADASIDLGPAGRDVGYGWGVPNPHKALERKTGPEPSPIPNGKLVRIEGTMEVLGS